jgi:hypothetical protein
MRRTYHGSCHCKAVTFEADIDLQKGTGKCNCTFCWKQRMWKAREMPPSDFRLLSGEDWLVDYAKSGDWGETHHLFCKRCGIATHGHSRIQAMGGQHTFSVHLSALDDLDVDELLAAPIHYMDGLHDDWQHPPAQTKHL